VPPGRRFFLTGSRQHSDAAVTITSACLARRAIHCQSCADACAEQAITFTPRLGGPPLPHIVVQRCTACGDCLAACPADAIEKRGRA
jgi:ferredoxin-type protein NapF